MQPLDRMLAEIAGEARVTGRITGRRKFDPAVMDAVAAVPRDAFVPERLKADAWDNRPLPIGYGQTISQPFMVALMTDLLEAGPEHRILEVGTGCGYQTAVLARLVHRVFSVEIVPDLGQDAARRLSALGFDNVTTRIGDGYQGWTEEAPFDGIIVTAAAPHVPPPLVEQLKPGARLVIPVGAPMFGQDLHVLHKDRAGKVHDRAVLAVAFVPLTGEHRRN